MAKKKAKKKDPQSLEILLRTMIDDASPEFRIGVMKMDHQGVHFLVHGVECQTETLHFIAKDNKLYQQ